MLQPSLPASHSSCDAMNEAGVSMVIGLAVFAVAILFAQRSNGEEE